MIRQETTSLLFKNQQKMNKKEPKIVWNMWQNWPEFKNCPTNVDHNFVWYDKERGVLMQYDFYTEFPIDKNHVQRGVWKVICHLKNPSLNV